MLVALFFNGSIAAIGLNGSSIWFSIIGCIQSTYQPWFSSAYLDISSACFYGAFWLGQGPLCYLILWFSYTVCILSTLFRWFSLDE